MPGSPELSSSTASTPSVTAEKLRADPVAMNPPAEAAASVPTTSETKEEPGKYATKGSELGTAVGTKIDALAARGSAGVESVKAKVEDTKDRAAVGAYELAGKVDAGVEHVKDAYAGAKERLKARAEGIRDKVKNGAELGAEKKAAAVSLAKEKSREAMLVAIGASIVAGEKVAEVPEKVKDRGRKIGRGLLRWGAKAFEAVSNRVAKTKESIGASLSAGAEKVGGVVENAVDRVDAAGQRWEARLQEARKEAEAAAEKARVEALMKAYVEARVEKTTKQANEIYDTKVSDAATERDATIDAAKSSAEGEVAGLTSEQIEARMAALGKEELIEAPAAPDEAPVAEAAPDASATPEAPVEMPAAA